MWWLIGSKSKKRWFTEYVELASKLMAHDGED